MSKIKFNPNLFLGKQELDRMQEFLDQSSFREWLIRNSASFGIVDNNQVNTNFKVSPGNSPATITIDSNSMAIDKLGQLISHKPTVQRDISIPLPNEYYWVKISYNASPIENGTVSIDSNGNLTGVGTSFLKVLRGLPNFPSRVKFHGSSLNTGEYVVNDVINDNNVVLQGAFQTEANLQYSVWGTFTPGHIANSLDANPFQYDNVTITLVRESIAPIDPVTQAPVKIQDLEFFIARVRDVNGIVEIEDKRKLNIWKSFSHFISEDLPDIDNPLIGVESVKWNSQTSPKDKNQVTLAWTFRSDNWTINPTQNLITINGGLGGRYKSTNQFNDGDFDNWRIYNDQGEFFNITQSVKIGTQINLSVEALDPDKFTSNTYINITPNAEVIEIAVHPTNNDDNEEQLRQYKEFPINTVLGKMFVTVPVLNGTYPIYIQYRYKNNQNYTEWKELPSDLVNGYYNEDSFDNNGEIKPIGSRVRQTYTSNINVGFIPLIPHPNSYANVLQRIDLGDLLGVEYQTTDNANPTISLSVGLNRKVQIINFGTVFSTDHVVNLRTANGINGNQFFLFFEGAFDRDNFNLTVNQNYINPGSPGSVLYNFNLLDDYRAENKDLLLRCDFDGTNWIVHRITSGKTTRWFYVGDPDPKVSLGSSYASGVVDSSSEIRFRLTDWNTVQLEGRVELFSDLAPDTGVNTSFASLFTLPAQFAITSGYNTEQWVSATYRSNTTTGTVNPNFNGCGVQTFPSGSFRVAQARHFLKWVYFNTHYQID